MGKLTAFHLLTTDDLILMGDVDEIPRGAVVRLLKWCDGLPLALGMTSRWYQVSLSLSLSLSLALSRFRRRRWA